MIYEEAVSFIDTICGQGLKLGLSRMEAILQRMGNPQNRLKIIHVAGTNGKGSTCAMLSSILKEAGYRVGVYTSPHLEEYNERYVIDHQRISPEDFAFYVEKVKNIYDQMKREGEDLPTVFEFITAMGFLYFAEKKVDLLLLEVGLGGRFDATNVISHPLLSILVSIGMDHMDYLGHNLAGIAMEKGGIIKEGCPVVLSTQGKEVSEVIEEIAKEKNAKFYYAKEQNISVLDRNLHSTIFSISNEYFSYDTIEITMLGEYQLKNCATVLLACRALQDLGIALSGGQILEGLKKAHWKGRMEICATNPLILLDGAHNADGIAMLAKSIQNYFEGKKITLLMGVLGDKEYEKMTELLIPFIDRVVITEPHNPRALDIESLSRIVEDYQKPVYQNKNIKEAFETAKKITAPEDVLCCAGSLYLIGEIRKFLTR